MAEEKKWTDEQRLAIDTRDRTLLISAAAGSGKTATLTERIIRSLLDEKSPENINEILIVTFTKAAVAELRERIGKAIREALKKNPESERLRRQLALLPSAKIQTIDSFCVDILRKNCDKVGVSPSFRVPDEAEARLLAITTMERLIDTVYDGLLTEVASPENFEKLSDGLTDSRGMSELSSVLLEIYYHLVDSEEGVDALAILGGQYSKGPLESGIIEYASERVMEMAAHYRALYRRAIAELSPETDKSGKFTDMCLLDGEYLGRFERAEGYSEIRTLICETARGDKPRLSASSSEAARFAIKVRCELDDDIKYFAEKIFFLEESSLAALFEKLGERVGVLHRFLSHFDRVFMAEKRRLAICEYSDIERYAYACLYDGAPTELAKCEAERYSSVYIDEYQDVNGIQNRIFEAISRPDNRFMVGDIKQSIYGFRGARPEIFAEMKRAFSPISKSEPGGSASIFMSRNFRSENPIIEFVNEAFDKIFEHSGKSIGYLSDDRLECGKKEKIKEPYPEIHILPKLSASTDREAEPCFAAELISRLISEESRVGGGEIAPKDVAILLRNDIGRISDFASAIERRNIPVRMPERGDFFLNAEILLALSLLCVVDNPRRDVYLAALMRSPLFDFSFDELILIRKSSDASTLYDALVDYCGANPDYARGAEFIATLNRYRRISEGLPVDEVVARLYRETGLVSTVGAEARANLDLLYEYARGFESSSFKGLYNFIRYVNSVIDKEMRIQEKQELSSDNAVKIITAHKSKGLEFPVVILADTAKSLSRRDRGRLHYAAGFAVSMTVRTESGLAVLENPVNNIISDYNSRLDFEEEMRVLYVALTRAKERLYIVGTSPNVKSEDFISKTEFLRDTLSGYSIYKLPSYLGALLATGTLSAKVVYHDASADFGEDSAEQAAEEKLTESEVCASGISAEELLSRFDYEYPDGYLTELPKKMAVSSLSPTVLDGSEDEPVLDLSELSKGENRRSEPLGKAPRFLMDTDPDDSAKRGIATHLFMQFLNLENLARGGVSAEIERLVSERYISAEDAALVRLDEIELFRNSRLFSEMRSAKKMYRELRFNINFPASAFTEDEKKRKIYENKCVLVQGVIDCIIERSDGELLLIDYKTDRLSDAELKNKALAAEKLTRVHASQLSYYKMAVEKMFGKPPLSVAIYSLPLGDTVEINDIKM